MGRGAEASSVRPAVRVPAGSRAGPWSLRGGERAVRGRGPAHGGEVAAEGGRASGRRRPRARGV